MNIREIINSGQIVRVDKDGEHVEKILEDITSKYSVDEILKLLNRHPDDLVDLYEKTQNKKLLNDIALAMLYKSMNSDLCVTASQMCHAENEYDKLRKEYDDLYKDYQKLKNDLQLCNEALGNAEETIAKLNHNVVHEDVKKASPMRRIGDEHVTGINIGV